MGMLLYLLLSAGFFLLMMRFGCGAHVMGHGQHRQHGAAGYQSHDELNRSTEESSSVEIIDRDQTNG